MHNLPIQIDLPQDFLKEEVRDGYTVTSDMKKLWAVEIDILFQIKAICDRHNIKWFVEGGTLLGAVRHKGYIPWDDDVDIDMFREDYERFIYYAKDELKYPYFLQTHETDKLSMYGHAKVRNSLTTSMQKFEIKNKLNFNQGVFVDIFPLDKIHDNFDEAKLYSSQVVNQFCFSRDRLYNTLIFKFFPLRKLCNRDKILYLIKGFKYIEKPYSQFEKMCIEYNKSNFNHYTFYAMPFSQQNHWPAELFEGDIENIPFEWFMVPALKKREEYLNHTFGNWHEFVIGTSLHGNVFVDTGNSYTKYL